MKKQILSLIYISVFSLMTTTILAQDTINIKEEVSKEKVRKNTVRINLTNPVIFGDKSWILGYERTLGAHKSFSINGGLASLPEFNLVNLDVDSTIQLNKKTKDRGFNITGDFRFYLASENKHPAPRGLYIGPFASHVFMGRENSWTLNTDAFQGDVITDFQFNMTAVGAQLGYQFVLWKRVALDFVLLGPSIAWYSLEAKLNTTLDPDEESLVYEKISEILTERFPGYTFAIDDVDFQKTGTTNTRSFGFRYTIHLGYRF